MQKVRLIQQVNDLREKLGEKTKDFNRLQRDVKFTKIKELQQEIQLYQQECLKLRYISEQAILILRQNGLQSLLKTNKQLQVFAREVKGDRPSELGVLYSVPNNLNADSVLNSCSKKVEAAAETPDPDLPRGELETLKL